jgi:quercetin dioxygenase-like cupin family protein
LLNSMLARTAVATAILALTHCTNAFAQQPPTGPGPGSLHYFNTLLENDPSREVRLQQQSYQPGPGTPYHTHPGDQWEAVLEGELTYMVRGQPPRVLKTGEWVYIPRGTVHRNENQSGKPARTIELLIVDKDKPQRVDAPAE